MKIKNILIFTGMFILLVGLVFAQSLVRFPNSFEISLPQLPAQQSTNQLLFGCPYDQNIEYRMVGIRNLSWSGDVPTVTADVKYWTKDRRCAGSKRFQIQLPLTLNQQSLVNNFQTRINQEFISEAQSNRQRGRSNEYIAGSSGATSVGIN